MTTSGTHAPLVNFVVATISVTIAVATAPTALITTPRCQFGSRSFRWWRTMPVCDSVNDMNTPTAYSGISALVTPPNATISNPAATREHERRRSRTRAGRRGS